MSDDLVSDIRCKYHRITKTINSHYWNSTSDTMHSLYVGSYGRGTSIGFSDVDIIVELPSNLFSRFNKYSVNGQSALLQDVKNVLSQTYSQSNISGDGQVVSIGFNSVIFEIVPAFLCNDGSFLYPDTNAGGSWKYTNPKPEIDAINKANSATNKNLKNLCRMIRSWNHQNNIGFDGQFIDATCYNYLISYKNRDKSFFYYDEMARDYFDYMHTNCNRSYWLMPGSNRFVEPNRSFRNVALEAYNHCYSAIKYQNSNHMYSACVEWREVFGNKFPF